MFADIVGYIAGKDAERFLQAMKNAKPLPKEQVDKMRESAKKILSKAKL